MLAPMYNYRINLPDTTTFSTETHALVTIMCIGDINYLSVSKYAN